ncbi:1918_t:CDS:2 [Scutellospora calospora]|uniref:1918_t:CDS:1 n=1 Tax=Scutellospora calospora TaxID=85575 RepID=A0ACA9KTM8_9GLOM|nr:1918_t:CDS:2 [Scutellospora calospora]
MIFDLAGKTLTSDNTLFLNEDTVFGLEDEEAQPIDFDDEEVISNITKKKILIKAPLDTTGILEEVKQNIYEALIYYWNDPSDLGLAAVLLDPRYKDLDFLEDDSEKQLIIQKLRDEFSELEEHVPELSTCPTLSNTEPATRSHKEYLQQRKLKRQKKDKMVSELQNLDEISKYLSLPLALTMRVFAPEWETQEQIIIESFSPISLKAVNKNTNNEQNSDSIEVNADCNSKEEPFNIITSKKSRNKTKKKDEGYPKSTRLLRKRDLFFDNK